MDFKIIRNKLGVSKPKTGRISWPWKDMDVGDQVVIPSSMAGRGQVSAHVYGRGQGKSFKTKTGDDGDLVVERIR